MKRLCSIAKEFDLPITQQLEDDAINTTLEHYKTHARTYKVNVTAIDPYKFASWSGMYLFNRIDNPNMIGATIATLRRFLLKEGKVLDDTFCKKLLVMAHNDAKNETVAIGKNGLYISFRTASELKNTRKPTK